MRALKVVAKAVVGLLAGLVIGLLILVHYSSRESTQPPPRTAGETATASK